MYTHSLQYISLNVKLQKGGEYMNEWVQLIQTVGFPISMCFAMAWYINKITSEITSTLVRIETVLEHLERGDES